MRIFIHLLCFFISRTFLSNEAFILQKDGNPCASSLFFETNVNPSSVEYTEERTRIDNPFILINPSSAEETSEETKFSSSISHVIKQNHVQESKSNLEPYLIQTGERDVESEKGILKEMIQLRVNTPEKVGKPAANRKRTLHPLIQFHEQSKSLLCPSRIQEEVEINPDNSQQLGTDLNRALELDVKTNPLQFQKLSEFQRYLEKESSSELETLDNSIHIDFTKLKSRPQIILRPHSSEQNTIKPKVNYIYLLLPKNESVVMGTNKSRAGVGDNLLRTNADRMQVGVNPVEVNSEKRFIHDLDTKLKILPSAINESTNNPSDDANKKGNGYELKVDELEMEYDYKEIDLSFLKNFTFRRRH